MDFAHAPLLVILGPFLAALLAGVVGLLRKSLCLPIAVIGIGVAFIASLDLLGQVLEHGEVSYVMGGWRAYYSIEFVVDGFNALILMLISSIAFLHALFSYRFIQDHFADRMPQFYTMYLLFIVGLSGIVITGDVFNLYVFLEISSLTSYALLALGRERAYPSTLNYLLMGSVGASFYLIGVGYLYLMTGTLNMDEISLALSSPALQQSQSILVGFIFIVVGMWIKMAFFPLHGWLPNAYSTAPAVVSSLIAPLATKVSVYVVLRIIFSVFTPNYVFAQLHWNEVITVLAVIAILAGSTLALAQTDLRRMLAYIIVAEVGYMVGGIWLGTENGISGAGFHIVSDALMTFCLFMATVIIVEKTGSTKLKDLKGVFREMPLTMRVFVIGALSMIGVPPTCGFFSKWYLILGAIEAHSWHFVAALLVSSLVNAVLFFRIIEIGFFQDAEEHGHHEDETAAYGEKEADFPVLVPMYVVAIGLVLVGLWSGEIVEQFIRPTL